MSRKLVLCTGFELISTLSSKTSMYKNKKRNGVKK